MRQTISVRQRRGAIIPLLAISIVALFGFCALAIDLGVLMVARTQCQNAADGAALAGVRTLSGDSTASYNYPAVDPTARSSAGQNVVLSNPISSSMVAVSVGSYNYNASTQAFVPSPEAPASDGSWSLVQVNINGNIPTFFGRIFNVTLLNTGATAQAIHRPRDVAVVMDLSGSMSFDSLPGPDISGPRTGGSNGSLNPEVVQPLFGHYSSASANFQFNATSVYTRPPTGEILAPSNITVDTAQGLKLVADFYKHPSGAGSAEPAFTAAPSGYATSPAGDTYLQKNGSWIVTVKDLVGGTSVNSTWENASTGGYDSTLNTSGTKPFKGYTVGPNYWGKTFWIWPPDPRGPANAPNPTAIPVADEHKLGDATDPVYNVYKDWRQRFFFQYDTSGGLGSRVPLMHNNLLYYDGSGSSGAYKGMIRRPDTTRSTVSVNGSTLSWRPNYRAILRWLKADVSPAPNPFGTAADGGYRLRAGRIAYYTGIPDETDTTLNPRWWSMGYNNNNERWWKEYIDYVIGIRQTGANSFRGEPGGWGTTLNGAFGYGEDFSWSGPSVTPIQIGPSPRVVNNNPNDRYMDYMDNPRRPKLHFWFGAMTMLDFMDNYNAAGYLGGRRYPGTCHQGPSWGCKIGMRAAFQDIRRNHPNDQVSLSFFNTPQYAPNTGGWFNRVIAPMGKSYRRAINALFYPIDMLDPSGNLTGPEIDPYNVMITQVPRADGSTTTAMGLLLSYNQFSSNPGLVNFNSSGGAPPGDAGGLGRKGAQKILILETDGVVNTSATAPLDTSAGAYNGYYQIRQPSEFPTEQWTNPSLAQLISESNAIAQAMCNLDTATPPGYSTPRKPCLIHTIAFGTLFDTSVTTNPQAIQRGNDAKLYLQNLQNIGKTQVIINPDGSETVVSDPNQPLAPYKIIVGPTTQRVQRMQEAFTRILQGGAQVSLIR